MGIIDRTTFTFNCPKCGTSEQSAAVERGSNYGGGAWGSPSPVSLFSVQWTETQFGEPRPASASCMKCGIAAKVSLA